jgi:hypothetical protein
MADKTKGKPPEGAKVTYDKLAQNRSSYLTRAEEAAALTIPMLFPKESDDASTNYDTPYQSIGARGVNNLASKLILAILPANQPFYRLAVDKETQNKLDQTQDDTIKTQIEYGLSAMETAMMTYMETNMYRPTCFEAMKQLVVAGNCAMFMPPKDGGIKMYTLRNYVVLRDDLGNVLQGVFRDTYTRASLPEEYLSALKDNGGDTESTQYTEKIDAYTMVYRYEKQYHSFVEIEGVVVPGTESSFPILASPWLWLRFTKRDGEHYGRGFVEEYIGDLQSSENLSKSIIDLAQAAARVFFLVNPGSLTSVRKYEQARNGSFVQGREGDIVASQLNKTQDLQVAKAAADDIMARLQYVFLLNSAVQRSGERVTAEEIRYVAGELEDTLGGVYSILAQEFQLPLVRRVFAEMQSTGALPAMKDGTIEPVIITGLDALGRGHDLNKLMTFLEVISGMGEALYSKLNLDNLVMRVAMSLGIDVKGLVKTDEQVMQEQQQNIAAQSAMAGGEAAATEAGAQMGAQQASAPM